MHSGARCVCGGGGICLLFSGFSNVCHSTCIWPTAVAVFLILTRSFIVNGFISLVDKIQIMLISSHHICIYLKVYSLGHKLNLHLTCFSRRHLEMTPDMCGLTPNCTSGLVSQVSLHNACFQYVSSYFHETLIQCANLFPADFRILLMQRLSIYSDYFV